MFLPESSLTICTTMKNKYLIISFIILTSSFLFAQDFSLGLKDGATWSSINGRFDFKNFNQTQIKNRVGHSFGLLLNYRATRFLSLQVEFNFEEKGFKFSDNNFIGGGYSGNYNINYFTMPIITNFEIGKKVKYYGYAGIYAGFLTKAENYTSFISTSSPDLIIYDLSYDPTEVFNKREFGGLVGLGIKIPLCEKVEFTIDSRYTFGLTKAAKNTDFDYDSNQWTTDTPDNFQNVYNRSFSISLGILYKLNNRN